MTSAEFPEVRPPAGREYPEDNITVAAIVLGGFFILLIAVLAIAATF